MDTAPCTGRLAVDGCQLAYRIDGAEGLPWLVFCNSLATDLSMWDAQVAHLAGHFRMLRYDQRGHGASAVPAAACTFDVLAGDLVALMDHLHIARASLVGISMGAVTVLAVAARHAGRVARVLACDGQWMAPPGARDAWEARIATAREQGMAPLVDQTVQRWFTPAFTARPSAALEQVRAMIAAAPPLGYIANIRALQDYDLRAEMAAISVPCMLLAGAEDGALPGVMRHMAAAIPGAQFVDVPAAGHLPNIEQADAFNALAGAFLGGAA